MTPNHYHHPSYEPPAPYHRCVAPGACVQAAHGGHRLRQECDCGALRVVNINGRHVEHGPWADAVPRATVDEIARDIEALGP